MSPVYTMDDSEFSKDICCCDCGTEIKPGMRYATRPEGVTPSGGLVEELVCIPCS